MHSKKGKFYVLFVMVLSLSLISAASSQTATKKHCYALLSPISAESISGNSQILESACFSTFAESISAATKGRVQLSNSATPATVTESILNNVSSGMRSTPNIVIGIDYYFSNYIGSSYTWVVSNTGCTSNTSYSVSTMPSGWDDIISSAVAYSNCNYFTHYEDTSFGGASVVCNTECSSMGSLNNATSSERWTLNP
jgi:hypothetical protein